MITVTELFAYVREEVADKRRAANSMCNQTPVFWPPKPGHEDEEFIFLVAGRESRSCPWPRR